MGVAVWIGPAIVAAVISALVTGMGWFVSERQTLRREAVRRRERIVDVQTAVLAEIRASRHRVENVSEYGAGIGRTIETSPGFTPFIPKQVDPIIFGAIRSEIYILPTQVIDPVVLYYRQYAVISNLIDDLRGTRFEALDQDRKRRIYADFVELLLQAAFLADAAETAIYRSLNIQVSDSSARRSAAVPGGALAEISSPVPQSSGLARPVQDSPRRRD